MDFCNDRGGNCSIGFFLPLQNNCRFLQQRIVVHIQTMGCQVTEQYITNVRFDVVINLEAVVRAVGIAPMLQAVNLNIFVHQFPDSDKPLCGLLVFAWCCDSRTELADGFLIRTVNHHYHPPLSYRYSCLSHSCPPRHARFLLRRLPLGRKWRPAAKRPAPIPSQRPHFRPASRASS